MTIYIGSDHAGFELKNKIAIYLKKEKKQFVDMGCFTLQSVDYSDTTKLVVKKVLEKKENTGVLVCGSGLGVNICANRFHGIYATSCFDEELAKMARKHNNSNILTLGARFLNTQKALLILKVWMETSFEGGRHAARIQKIDH